MQAIRQRGRRPGRAADLLLAVVWAVALSAAAKSKSAAIVLRCYPGDAGYAARAFATFRRCAEQIAKAVRHLKPSNDIAVLTLCFAEAEVLHA